MKIKYIIYTIIIVVELNIIRALNVLEISAQSFIGNVVGVLISLFPILLLLKTLSCDDSINVKVRSFCRLLFWFIVICYFSGIVAEIISR